MKALILREKGVSLEDISPPQYEEGKAIVKVAFAGICGTDKSILRGKFKVPRPIILGHEFSGVVSRSTMFQRGTPVVAEINVPCGKCEACKRDMKNHCLRRRILGINTDGAFAEYIAVPEENLHVLPANIDLREAVLVEPLAAALRQYAISPPHSNDLVVVLGCGPLGLLSIITCPSKRVLAVDPNNWKRKIALELGAWKDSSPNDLIEEVLGLTNGLGADYVVEASGKPESLNLALKVVRPLGTVSVKSTPGGKTIFNSTLMVRKEVRVFGSRCGPFSEAIKLLGKLPLHKLITHIFSIREYGEALDEALYGRSLKVLLAIGEGDI